MSSTSESARAMGGYDRRRHGIHNLSRAEIIADPTRYIDAIAEVGPLFYDEVGHVWICCGYRECVEILGNHRAFSSARPHNAGNLEDRGFDDVAGIVGVLSRQVLFSDPPGHTAVRSAMGKQFTPSRVAEQDPMMREIVRHTLATLPAAGPIDLVTDFAEKLPTQLVASLLGMQEHAKHLTTWADAYERLISSLSTLPSIKDRQILPILDDALSAFRATATQRLRAPQDDLISRMVTELHETVPAEAIDIVASNCLVMVAGGYQTLTHLITGGLLLLDEHPRQQQLLRADPELADSAINEILRIDGSSQYVARRAVVDTVVADRTISAGETVITLLAAANLDPRKFTDPRVFDIGRKEGRHLGFGLGRHYCIGAPYAERLARWAILGFLERYGEYRLASRPDAVTWGPHSNTRCPAHAYVEVSGPEKPNGLTKAEQYTLTTAWNDTDVPLGPLDRWHQVFEHRAGLSPGAIAVDDAGTEHTYQDIDNRANALAWELRSRGVEPESVVTILMERSADMVIAMLAVAKAGGAFMLADVQCPPERLAVMLGETSARLVLTDWVTLPKAQGLSTTAEVLAVDTSGRTDERPVTGVNSGNTAYVVFTSGTTGRPKGIAINHEGVVNLHRAHRDVFRVAPADRVLQFLSPNFDGCVYEVVMALLCGATLVVVPATRLVVGPSLVRLLRDQRITIVTLTPSVWAALPVEPLPELRVAAACGERLPAKTVAAWTAPGRRFLNLYGPAETAVWATWHECDGTDDEPPIGRGVPNKRLYIVDDQFRLAPIGQEGELCVAGLGIGRYLGRPELMSGQFRIDPFTSRPGQILYRTGDICRWRTDGVLEYRGRRDRQTKIRGQRVELDEVERVLGNAAGVVACAVFEQDGRLNGMVVTDAAWDEQAVRSYLRDRLHSGMIPAELSVVDELPRTLNGKLGTSSTVRPAALAEPVERPSRSQEPSTARLTWQIARLFASCLRIPQHQVKADSDFFDIGGDSLTVAEFLAGLERETRIAIDVEALLASPTPARIAAGVADRLRGSL